MSKAFLIILVILVVLFLLLYPFLGALIKDKRDLVDTTLEELFPFFFKTISDRLFDGKGKIHTFDDNPKAVNMMSTDPNCQNMIVHFLYSTGNMIMEVGFKYYQEEVRFVHTAYNLRGGSAFVQKDLANAFVEVAAMKIYNHKLKVTKLLHPDEVVSHISINKPFDQKDAMEIVEDSFSRLTDLQKQAVICVGYLIATANGDAEELFLGNPAVRQQLRFFNVAWPACKALLLQIGEDEVCKTLQGIDKDTIVMIEGFIEASCISVFTREPDPIKVDKRNKCLSNMGISLITYQEIADKNKAIMEYLFNKLT